MSQEEESAKREDWERQPRETNAAWAAFQVYRDMLPAHRTLRDAYRAAKGPDKVAACGTWRGWAEHWRWKERAEAYDLHADEQARLELEHQRIEARKATATLGRTLREKAQEAASVFKGISEKVETEDGEEIRTVEANLSPYQMARLATVGVSLERLALGEPQTTVDITSGGRVVVFSLPDNGRGDRGTEE